MNPNDLLDRARSPTYNCADYAAEVWADETGEDIRAVVVGYFAGESVAHPIASFRRISKPIDPCVVLMRRGQLSTHIGIYRRGRVQHLAGLAPIRQPLHIAALGYGSVKFYAPRSPRN